MWNKVLIGAGALALATGAALADQGELDREHYYAGRGPMPFEVYDLDDNGQVSEQEHALVRAQRMQQRARAGFPMRNAAKAPSFEAIDSDGDGSIDRDELQTWTTLRQQQQGPGRRWTDR